MPFIYYIYERSIMFRYKSGVYKDIFQQDSQFYPDFQSTHQISVLPRGYTNIKFEQYEIDYKDRVNLFVRDKLTRWVSLLKVPIIMLGVLVFCLNVSSMFSLQT